MRVRLSVADLARSNEMPEKKAARHQSAGQPFRLSEGLLILEVRLDLSQLLKSLLQLGLELFDLLKSLGLKGVFDILDLFVHPGQFGQEFCLNGAEIFKHLSGIA